LQGQDKVFKIEYGIER